MKKGVTILTEVVTANKAVEPEGATMIEFIRDVTCDDTVTIAGAITLNDDNPSHLFAYDKDYEIKTPITVKFAGVGSVLKVVVVKSIYDNK